MDKDTNHEDVVGVLTTRNKQLVKINDDLRDQVKLLRESLVEIQRENKGVPDESFVWVSLLNALLSNPDHSHHSRGALLQEVDSYIEEYNERFGGSNDD